MRIPKIRKYDTSSDFEVRQLAELDVPRRWYDLNSKKGKDKFVKAIEKLVRTSDEYKELIEYLKNNMGMNFCSFFHNVSRDLYGKAKISIEIHHEPFTLYDICHIVLLSHMRYTTYGETIDMYDIAEEVMQRHYQGWIGLVPLSTTVHELVHSGKLFIPLQFIDRGFNKFYEYYEDDIKEIDGMVGMLEAKVRLSKMYAANKDGFISILKKRFIYVDNEKYNNIPEALESIPESDTQNSLEEV